MEELYQANLNFHELGCNDPIQVLPHVAIKSFRLHHPNSALGCLLNIEGVRIAYLTDHEHEVETLSPTMLQETSGVDILIHDAQYTREELRKDKTGWGRSVWEDVVQFSIKAEVKQLYLFHHDPETTDGQLNARQFMAQQIFPQTFVAREGVIIPLPVSRAPDTECISMYSFDTNREILELRMIMELGFLRVPAQSR